jgi:hypothetical protein
VTQGPIRNIGAAKNRKSKLSANTHAELTLSLQKRPFKGEIVMNIMQTVIWIAAAGLLLLYLKRRRKRRTTDD